MPPPRVAPFEPQQFWQQASEPIFWLDPALKLSWVNRAWEQLTGYPAESVVGLTCQNHAPTHAGDLADLAASFHPPPESLAGRPAGTPTLIFHAGGERLWRRLEFWPFRDEHQTLIGLLGQVRPVDCQPSVPDTQVNPIHVELLETRRQLQNQYGFDSLIGFGPSHRRLLEQVRLAIASKTPVLIVGEAGTGKQQVARTIHQQGPGRQWPLVPFDCEALPAEILERELFGVEKPNTAEGGFHQPTAVPTLQDPALRRGNSPAFGCGPAFAACPPGGDSTRGAAKPRLSPGDGSTLLVREILKLPRDLQARLVASLDAPVRLLATTALDPETARKNEQLRPELYFALTTLVLRLLPLRERRDELPMLAQHLLERANQRGGHQRSGFSPQAISALMTYDWPGNLRELARVIDHAHAHPQGDGTLGHRRGAPAEGQGAPAEGQGPEGSAQRSVALEDLPASIRGNLGAGFPPPTPATSIKPLDELLTEVERRLIETALRQARSNKSRAAEMLGISRPRLYRRIKELNLPDDAESADDIETSH